MSEIGDALVTTTIVDADSTWNAPVEERILFGLCCVLHHAGANGLNDMWSLNEGQSVEVFASALEGLELIGERRLHGLALQFWNHMITPAVALGLNIPAKYSDTKQGDYDEMEKAIIETDVMFNLPPNVQEADGSFVSCWNTSFPDSVLNWIRTFEEQLAPRICKD
jgi:hypothetical protein